MTLLDKQGDEGGPEVSQGIAGKTWVNRDGVDRFLKSSRLPWWVVHWLILNTSNAGGKGSIPGQGIKVPHAMKSKEWLHFCWALHFMQSGEGGSLLANLRQTDRQTDRQTEGRNSGQGFVPESAPQRPAGNFHLLASRGLIKRWPFLPWLRRQTPC